jgi:uncharacterized protein
MSALDQTTPAALRQRLGPALRKAGVRPAILFGSCARGAQSRRSDVDLILVMDTSDRFLKRHDRVRGVYECLRGIPTDILIYTPDELHRMAHRPFLRRALAEGKVIYGDGA